MDASAAVRARLARGPRALRSTTVVGSAGTEDKQPPSPSPPSGYTPSAAPPVLKGTGLRVCVRTGSRAFGLIKSMDQKNRKVLTQKQRVSAASRHGKSASRRSVQFSRVHLKPPTLTSTK